ncbi:MAG: DUF4386 domain-containing protein [Chthoniobacterales bacterium]
MNIAVMMKRIREASPRFKARVAGVFYLLSVLTAVFAEAFVSGRLLFAVGLIPVLCFIAVTLLLYGIFKPVNRGLSLLATCANLIGLAFEALELQLQEVNVALVFHGFYCLLIGYLIIRSTFLPRILGVLMAVAGLAWLTSLSPPLADYLHLYSQAVGFLGEGLPMLWLLVRGVDVSKWKEKAGLGSAGTASVL